MTELYKKYKRKILKNTTKHTVCNDILLPTRLKTPFDKRDLCICTSSVSGGRRYASSSSPNYRTVFRIHNKLLYPSIYFNICTIVGFLFSYNYSTQKRDIFKLKD